MDAAALLSEFFSVSQRFGRVQFTDLFYGVSKGELVIMQMLSEHHERSPDAEGMYVSELAAQTEQAVPSVSRLLRNMEEKGYIERLVDRNNRRNTFIRLTPEGTAMHRKIHDRLHGLMCRVVERIGEDDMRKLLELWKQLLMTMRDEINNEKGGPDA